MVLSQDEFSLINAHQRDFPLVPRPYAELGAKHGISEAEVIDTYRDMIASGALSRIGVVFRPNTVGASTLAAMAVPEDRLEEIARTVSSQSEVNHNYQREHRLNLWFVVAGSSPECVERAIATIERDTGIDVLRLPLLEEFHIDLGFDLADGSVPRMVPAPTARLELNTRERALVAALDAGMPLCANPYATLGRQCDMSEAEVIRRLTVWVNAGIVRRIGTVVRHRPLGFRANAMVVWNVPDGEVSALGRRAAVDPAVTLCYRRARVGGAWPYNLFCMFHGRERDAVRDSIRRVAIETGLERYPSEILFSTRCFTQRGARYAESVPAPAQSLRVAS
jgi:DNA-binding Lrp family transcriptional regulator